MSPKITVKTKSNTSDIRCYSPPYLNMDLYLRNISPYNKIRETISKRMHKYQRGSLYKILKEKQIDPSDASLAVVIQKTQIVCFFQLQKYITTKTFF